MERERLLISIWLNVMEVELDRSNQDLFVRHQITYLVVRHQITYLVVRHQSIIYLFSKLENKPKAWEILLISILHYDIEVVIERL